LGNVSQADIDRKLLDIRKLKETNNTDSQIMDILGIEPATYRRYVHRIHMQDKEAWLLLTSQQYETELIRLKESLESTYRTTIEMLKDIDNKEVLDKLSVLEAKDDARLSIVHLLTEGPEMIKKVEDLLNGRKNSKKKGKMDIQREEQEETTT
jgi:hypothetical protein